MKRSRECCEWTWRKQQRTEKISSVLLRQRSLCGYGRGYRRQSVSAGGSWKIVKELEGILEIISYHLSVLWMRRLRFRERKVLSQCIMYEFRVSLEPRSLYYQPRVHFTKISYSCSIFSHLTLCSNIGPSLCVYSLVAYQSLSPRWMETVGNVTVLLLKFLSS